MDPRQILDGLQDIVKEYIQGYERLNFEETRVRLLARLNEGARELDQWIPRTHASDSLGREVTDERPR